MKESVSLTLIISAAVTLTISSMAGCEAYGYRAKADTAIAAAKAGLHEEIVPSAGGSSRIWVE